MGLKPPTLESHHAATSMVSSLHVLPISRNQLHYTLSTTVLFPARLQTHSKHHHMANFSPLVVLVFFKLSQMTSNFGKLGSCTHLLTISKQSVTYTGRKQPAMDPYQVWLLPWPSSMSTVGSSFQSTHMGGKGLKRVRNGLKMSTKSFS